VYVCVCVCVYIYIYIYITRLASNEKFSPSKKIHREVGRAKDLSAPSVVHKRSKSVVFVKRSLKLMELHNSVSLHKSGLRFHSTHITKIQSSLLRKSHVSCASPCYVLVLTCSRWSVLAPLSGIFVVGWKYQTWWNAEIGHCKCVFLFISYMLEGNCKKELIVSCKRSSERYGILVACLHFTAFDNQAVAYRRRLVLLMFLAVWLEHLHECSPLKHCVYSLL